jgi:glyceraldehyde 3-phosphate dehydrogenase
VAAKVAINGFGRIGRNILRALSESGRTDVQVVAINDLAPPATNAHLFRYDSVHGPFKGRVQFEGDTMDVGSGPIKVLAERDMGKLPWGDLGVDIVLECTGIFTSKEKASGHISAGCRKVLISAPARTRTSPSSTASTTSSSRRSTRSSATPRAPPTAWSRWPRS